MAKRISLISFLFLLNAVAFQNCDKISSQAHFSQDSTKLNHQEAEGGGQPFDGKIFVLTGALCPDQTNIQSKIILWSETSASLVREKCQNISPVELGPTDFQLDLAGPNTLSYQNQSYVIVGTKIDMNLVTLETGFSYWLVYDFGTAPDDETGYYISKLQIYENGRPLGPAHALHDDIRQIGLGRFSYWKDYLRFSSSDNTDPRMNGRTYTYEILDQSPPP